MTETLKKITGVGSPVMDMLARVDDEFVSTYAGEKGGMSLVDSNAIEELVGNLKEPTKLASGGAAANTIFAMARLGDKCSFVGKLGNDEQAKKYQQSFEALGGDSSRFKFSGDQPTARCLSLVTPDYERTMRTSLAAAAELKPEEISEADFAGCGYVHIEGYLLFNADLIKAVLKKAKQAGCTISLDLGSFEIVKAFKDMVAEILRDYVDIVFANSDEASAFCDTDDPHKSLDILSEYCDVAIVKLGAEGSLIKTGGNSVTIEALKVDNAIDSTGAGDYWAAGFLHGYIRGCSLKACGQMGSILGAEVVQQLGAELPEEKWKKIEKELEKLS